uniref:PWI domain-containing protein n=1 Tax=Rhizophora mucronata TaxID=61149 RepID=A0A2P2J7B2_RHIMU
MTDDVILQNGTSNLMAESDAQQSGNAPARKLGFGLVGSGKRAAVPSVFHEEDDDEAHKDKKMRPLVPIDYSTEELHAIQPASGAQQPNLVAAAEFAKRLSNVAPKEERSDAEKERNRRSRDRSRDRDRNEEETNRTRDENKERILEWDRDRGHGIDKVKTPDKQKLLDAKQLIDMIPRTKDELFSYEINWAVYDKHGIHERMRPWISKKITEFLGEEETTLVDYIVSSTQEHVRASQMLEMLQAILDEEAEMFVLKMWRMLIFEIKKVETGLSFRPKA